MRPHEGVETQLVEGCLGSLRCRRLDRGSLHRAPAAGGHLTR
jgi:hypothetical protein